MYMKHLLAPKGCSPRTLPRKVRKGVGSGGGGSPRAAPGVARPQKSTISGPPKNPEKSKNGAERWQEEGPAKSIGFYASWPGAPGVARPPKSRISERWQEGPAKSMGFYVIWPGAQGESPGGRAMPSVGLPGGSGGLPEASGTYPEASGTQRKPKQNP